MPLSNDTGLPHCAFGVFADLHYAPTVYDDRFCRDSLGKLGACMEVFNRRSLSLAVNLGDSIDSGPTKDEELSCLKQCASAFALFRGQRRVLIGNHDVSALTNREFLDSWGADCVEPYYSFDHEGFHFVALDGNCRSDGSDFAAGNFDWSDAWVADDQLRWLGRDLAASASKPAVILCHECLDEYDGDSGPDPHVVGNHCALRLVLEGAGNVAAVISGHFHPGRSTVVNGIPYLRLSAMCEGPSPGNNAFAIVSLTGGEVHVEGFGRQESRRFRVDKDERSREGE